MATALPGDPCPQTGTWVPSNNPNFYPSDYAAKVMNRNFVQGEIIPATPHGEPSWILREQGNRIENFTGLSEQEIMEKVKEK